MSDRGRESETPVKLPRAQRRQPGDISYEDIFGEETERIATISRMLKSQLEKLKRPSAPSVSAATNYIIII